MKLYKPIMSFTAKSSVFAPGVMCLYFFTNIRLGQLLDTNQFKEQPIKPSLKVDNDPTN